MYGFKISDEAKSKLSSLGEKYKEGLTNGLDILNTNPLLKAKPTNNRLIGEYYINCGNQHCILFDLDEENNIVLIRRILRRPFLHKVLTRKIMLN